MVLFRLAFIQFVDNECMFELNSVQLERHMLSNGLRLAKVYDQILDNNKAINVYNTRKNN